MTLLEAAKIYASLVKTDPAYPESEPFAKDQLNALRTGYHVPASVNLSKILEGQSQGRYDIIRLVSFTNKENERKLWISRNHKKLNLKNQLRK